MRPGDQSIAAVTDQSGIKSYRTTFNTPGNPVSDFGTWHNNGGASWTSIVAASNRVHGTQNGLGGTNDSYAYLQNYGFSPDQRAWAVVSKTAGTLDFQEIEILLRWTDSAGDAHGYECNLAHDGAYAQVVRWNGPFNNFTYVADIPGVPAPANGDTFYAEITGTIVRTYLNSTLLATADITSIGGTVWTTGQPGMAFYTEGVGRDNTALGYSSYNAEDVVPGSLTFVGSLKSANDNVPTVTGNWIIGFWFQIGAGEYGGAGERVPIMIGNQGVEGFGLDIGIASNTTLSAVLYRNSGATITSQAVLTGSDTGWAFGALQHVSGSADYTFRFRREGGSTFTTLTLNVGAQLTMTGTKNIWIGTDFYLEQCADSTLCSMFMQATTMTDPVLLAASRNLAPPAGTNFHALRMALPSTAGVNLGSGSAFAVTGAPEYNRALPNVT